jgi:hypothetical protein
MTPYFAIGILLIGSTSAMAWGTGPPAKQDVRKITLTRTIHIRTVTVSGQDSAERAAPEAASLVVWSGAPDEPPEGPDGFYVKNDGGVIITDPLRNRLISYDSQGNFLRSYDTGQPADHIDQLLDGSIVFREATTGRLLKLDADGRSKEFVQEVPAATEKATLENSTSGSVSWPAIGAKAAGEIKVVLDRPNADLVSLQSLGRDSNGNLYVALEISKDHDQSEGLAVSKYVQKYSGDGMLVCETTDIPLDYYVTPVDELRVKNGILSQLRTTQTEVSINLWNMN